MDFNTYDDVASEAAQLANILESGSAELSPEAQGRFSEFASSIGSDRASEVIRLARDAIKEGSAERIGAFRDYTANVFRETRPWTKERHDAMAQNVLDMGSEHLVPMPGAATGFFEGASRGTAQELANLYSGAKQFIQRKLLNASTTPEEVVSRQEALTQEQTTNRQNEELYRNSLIGTRANIGSMVGEAVPLALAGSMTPLSSIAGGMALGGLEGAVHPHRGDAITGMALGGVGGAIGRGVVNALAPAKSTQHKLFMSHLVNKAGKKGYWTSPGMQTGADTDMWFDTAISRRPEMASKFQQLKANNQNVFNKEAAEQMGITSDVDALTPEVISEHMQELGGRIKEAYTQYPANLRPSDWAEINKIDNRIQRVLGKEGPKGGASDPAFRQTIGRMKTLFRRNQMHGVPIQGETLKQLRGDLVSLVSKHYGPTGDRTVAAGYSDLLGVLDDAVERNIADPAVYAAVRKDRKQYAFMKNLITNNGIDLVTGDVRPKAVIKLMGKEAKKNSKFYAMHPELFDSARFLIAQQQAMSQGNLPMSTWVSKLFKPLHRKGEKLPVLSMLSGGTGATQIPLLNQLSARAYLMGWPGRTGILGPLSPRSGAADPVGYLSAGLLSQAQQNGHTE